MNRSSCPGGWSDKCTDEESNGFVSLSLVRFYNVTAIYSGFAAPYSSLALCPVSLSLGPLELHCSPLSQFALQRAANMIPAHDSPLAALAFDASGTKLATASEKVSQEVKLSFFRSAFALILCLLPPREQSFASSPSRRARSSSSSGEESKGASASARWPSASTASTCRPPATRKRCTSSNWRPRRRNMCKQLLLQLRWCVSARTLHTVTVFLSQACGGAHHVGRLPGQGADGFHNLPAFPGHGNVHPGPSLCHRPAALLRPQEHLRLSCVSSCGCKDRLIT